MKPILVTANSPGEVAWLKSIAAAAQTQYGASIEVLLLPCTFATGHEAEVASALPGVKRVHPKSSYLPLLLWEGRHWDPDTTLIHLGGDLMYSAFLSWRWGWKSWSYLWARPWWDSAFQGYFARDLESVQWLRRKRTPEHKIHVVGDLVVDSVLGQVPEPVDVDPNLICLLPGSRRLEAQRGAPLYLGIAEKLWQRRPKLHFRLMISPFLATGQGEISATLLEELLTLPPEPRIGGTRGRLEKHRDQFFLTTPAGLRVEVICRDHMQALAPALLALSIPGTKTAEAATLGVPCLTIVPLNCPEQLPAIGLLGLLDWLPGGKHLKGRIMTRMKDRVGLLAQPNQRAGKALMPEIVEFLSPDSICAEIENLLAQPQRLQEVRGQLRDLYRPLQGAATKILAATFGPVT